MKNPLSDKIASKNREMAARLTRIFERIGKKGVIALEMVSGGSNRGRLLGFTAFLEKNGELNLKFMSRSVNSRFAGNTIPVGLQGTVRKSVTSATGRTAR